MSLVVGQRSFTARSVETEAPSTRETVFGGLLEDRFSTAEQSGPLPVAWGQFQIGAGFMTPIFRDRAVLQGGGKKTGGAGGGYQYNGYYAVSFCHGRLDELTELRVSDKAIWTGPLTRSGGNEDGVLISTDLGNAMWYWGNETQLADPTLQTLNADQPGFRGTAYLVLMDFLFGSSASPPQITLIGKRALNLLTIAQHTLSGDAILPEVLYDVLTNVRYGARVDPQRIDKTSFETAATTIIAEDLGASPVIAQRSSLRDVVAKLLTYMRGVFSYDGAKLKLKLLRDDPAEIATDITIDDLEDAPEPQPGDWAATWSRTRVNYTNAAGNWERDVIAYTDPANARIRGYVVDQDVDRDWFTRTSVAKKEAARIGTLNGLPLASNTGMRLKPSWRTTRPGQLLRLVYPKLNIAASYLRPERVIVGGPNDPAVTIDAIEDPSRQTTLGYTPASSATGQPGRIAQNLAAATVRIATLTATQKDGALDGLLVAISRPTGLTVRSETWFTWDPALASYGRLASTSEFPILGTVLWWLRNGASWIVRFKVSGSWDAIAMADIAEAFDDYFFVMGRRVVVTSPASDTHKLLSVVAKRKLGGRFAAIAADTFDIEVDAAQQGTTNLALETLAAGASAPTGTAYFGLLSAFTFLRGDTLAFDRNQGNDPADSQKRRYIKALVGDENNLLSLADVTAVEFKRADSSMDANGSYAPTWGARAKTGYEYCDDEAGLQYAGTPGANYANVGDLDDALGRVLEGTATAGDTALLADSNDVLGAYLGNGNGIYNDAP